MKFTNVLLGLSLAAPFAVISADVQSDDIGALKPNLAGDETTVEPRTQADWEAEWAAAVVKFKQAEKELEFATNRLDMARAESGRLVPNSDGDLEKNESAAANALEKYKEALENCRKLYAKRHRVDDEPPCWYVRGCRTFLFAPCNYLRTFEAMDNVCATLRDEDGYDRLVGIASVPAVFGLETVPAACDIVNGLLDLITVGAYGDLIYSRGIKHCWKERNNTRFPWLD